MPTPTKGHRLGGSPAHQRHILANLATALFEHGKITTTEARARRLRPVAERLITFAKRGDLHARRQVLGVLTDRTVVHTLFADIGPSFASRDGGYTRITKVPPRKGDNAAMAVIELIREEADTRTRRRRARRVQPAAAPGGRRARRDRPPASPSPFTAPAAADEAADTAATAGAAEATEAETAAAAEPDLGAADEQPADQAETDAADEQPADEADLNAGDEDDAEAADGAGEAGDGGQSGDKAAEDDEDE